LTTAYFYKIPQQVFYKDYFLAGKALSRTLFVPHDAAAPITPPATALPIKTAPPTTNGGILESGFSFEKERGRGRRGLGIITRLIKLNYKLIKIYF
jgi:hypothetical protein